MVDTVHSPRAEDQQSAQDLTIALSRKRAVFAVIVLEGLFE
jgi:hypothetical protein